jgi:dienelactone hydrolase
MTKAYERWIRSWEDRLCNRATNRVVRHFEWGLDWTGNWPSAQRHLKNGESPEDYVYKLNQAALLDSDEFFAYDRPKDFRLEDNMLRFESPVRTPYPENNVVHARWFPAKDRRRAVVVLPHWNCPADAHYGLCRGLQRLGISNLRLSLPYHDYRMPAELQRADYAMSANVCRTIDATRQAVIDTRCCFDWLELEGFERLGIVGTSLGSSYACLASAHDPRIAVNVFNHCSTYVADVVWTGLSTQHVRKTLEQHLDLDRLRELWRAISPISYLEKFAERPHKSLFIYAAYDTTFLPHLSKDIVSKVGALGVDHKVVILPCGHYTLGETPFKFIDGYHICKFLTKNL